MSDATPIGVGKAAAVDEQRCQAWRLEADQRGLCMGGIRKTKGADLAVAPVLLNHPLEGVKTILGIADVFGELALGSITTSAIL